MATITLKINEKTKKGQIFLDFLKQYVQADKTVEIINVPNEETLKAMKNVEAGIGLTKSTSHEDLMKKLNS
jgi:antitoxin component of RelBE/YafQ-DinJ toxin-antitoxin module